MSLSRIATFHAESLLALELSAWPQLAVKQANKFFFRDPPEGNLPVGGD
jgi:hypothetical protein